MTSQTDDQQAEPDKGGDDGPTMGDVRKLVAEEISAALEPIKKLLGGGADKPGDKPPADAPAGPGADIDGMINNAIAKVLGDKDKAAAEDEHAKEHARIREAAAERPPLDRKKRSRWLGAIYDE